MSDWIDWQDGECPVAEHKEVHAKLRSGEIVADPAGYFLWHQTGERNDIVAYRVSPTFADLAEKDAEINRLRAELAGAREDAQESAELRDRMSGLLTGVANALRGEPNPLSLHSWHNLPELARQAREVLDLSAEAMASVAGHLDHLRTDRDGNKFAYIESRTSTFLHVDTVIDDLNALAARAAIKGES